MWLILAIVFISGCHHTAESLLRDGTIDAHRRVAVNDTMEAAVWVIQHRKTTDQPTTTAVLLHPWLTDKGYMLDLGKSLAREGWDVVLIDLRNHGRSTWGPSGWGGLEANDVRIVVDQLVKEKLISDEIYAMGISLGGCVAMLYSQSDPRCKGVLAVVPVDGIRGIVERTHFGPEPVEEKIVSLAAESGVDPVKATPSEMGKQATIPLIMVTAWFDIVVPSEQTDRIYENWGCANKRKVSIPGGHGSIQIGTNWVFQIGMNDLREMAAEKAKP